MQSESFLSNLDPGELQRLEKTFKVKKTISFVGIWDDYDGDSKNGRSSLLVILIALIILFSTILYRAYDLKKRELDLKLRLSEARIGEIDAEALRASDQISYSTGSSKPASLNPFNLSIQLSQTPHAFSFPS